MLKTQTANLPQDQRRLVHPDFLADEQAYLDMRPHLLTQFPGQWVAIKGGHVIAAGPSLLEIMEKAAAAGGHPYIALVGAEDSVVFRVRRGTSLTNNACSLTVRRRSLLSILERARSRLASSMPYRGTPVAHASGSWRLLLGALVIDPQIGVAEIEGAHLVRAGIEGSQAEFQRVAFEREYTRDEAALIGARL